MGGEWTYRQQLSEGLTLQTTQDHTMAELSFFDGADLFETLNITYNDTEEFWLDPSTTPCSPPPPSDAAMTGVSVFYALVFLLAVPGNLLVGVVICLNKRPLSSSDLYLLHLAVADVLLAATLPFWAAALTLGWLFGDAVCKMVSVLQELSFYVSILLLACISADRCLAVAPRPPAAPARRRPVSWCVCGGVWAAGALLSLPGLLNSATPPGGGGGGVCAEHHDPGGVQRWRLATRGLSHTLGFALPLAVMLLCYGAAARRLLRTKAGFRRQRAMRLMVAVVAAFLLCWTPYHAAVLADTLLRAGAAPYGCLARSAVGRAVFATQSLGLLHSGVNPVLYAFAGRKFRGRLENLVQKTGERRASTPRPSKSSSTIL